MYNKDVSTIQYRFEPRTNNNPSNFIIRGVVVFMKYIVVPFSPYGENAFIPLCQCIHWLGEC
jgi:hypothetical protein